MSTLQSMGSNPREAFHLQRIVYERDTDSCIAVAHHVRTGSPIDVIISLQQVLYGLRVCCGSDNAIWCLEQLKEHNVIETSAQGTAFYFSPNELVQFGFKEDDVCRVIEKIDGSGEQGI